MSKFETVKLFDCQDMPQEVRTVFYDKCGSPSFRGSNDCVVEWTLWGHTGGKHVSGVKSYSSKNIYQEEIPYAELNDGEIFEEWGDDGEKYVDGERYVIQRGDCIVSDWLKDNGAELNEEVLIKHWW